MKIISLSQGLSTKVDDDVFNLISKWKWCISTGHLNKKYACRNVYKNGKRVGFLRMHRVITKAKKGEFVDHIDGDTLNNTRDNLRICTFSENQMNRSKTKLNKSGFKGVDFRKSKKTNPYRAVITVNGKIIHLGYFPTAISAAKSYNEAATKYHGEFAYLNPIPDGV
jgi:hypothetical protein